jgi:competence protein ComEA
VPRIDLDMRAAGMGKAPPGAAGALIDVNQADAAQLERLPGVGPALARRILASRDSLGPFGGLSALGRVKGVGPSTLRRLAPLVTFSGQARR